MYWIRKYDMLVNIIISILFLQTVSCWDLTNENNSLYRVTAFNTRERSVLYNIHVKSDAVIFLNGVTNEAATPMHVVVNDCCTEEFEISMQRNEIEYVKILNDSVLKEFNSLNNLSNKYVDLSGKVPLLNEKFFNWADIMSWVQHTVKKCHILKKIHIGETYEGKEIFVLKVSSGHKKPAVFIMGGEQGRDWMSPAVILNFIHFITTKRNDALSDIYDLYFMPVFNPDGYEYSITTDRFWNKNRKKNYPEKVCIQHYYETAVGVSIERNWYITNSTHTYDEECDSVYIGEKSLGENEPKALSTFLNTIAVDLMAFINLRGSAKLITVPYAEATEFANNYAILVEMLLHASDKAFQKYNVSYNLCSTGSCFYNQTGNAPDWVKKFMNVPIVYSLYMKHDDSFLPRLEQIPILMLHFEVIVKETLLLAHSIYGPLFNCKAKLSNSFVTIVALISLLYLNKI